MFSEQAQQESNLQPPVLEASLPRPPKTRRLRNCPRKPEIARYGFRARPRECLGIPLSRVQFRVHPPSLSPRPLSRAIASAIPRG